MTFNNFYVKYVSVVRHEAVNCQLKLAKEMSMKAIMEQYNKVFDANGNVKTCTREQCIKLIEMLEEKFPNEDFGNDKTGFMDTERIKELVNRLD